MLEAALPPDTAAVLRGSAITGQRHGDDAPFDADGPGTSDLDLTLVGGIRARPVPSGRLLHPGRPLPAR